MVMPDLTLMLPGATNRFIKIDDRMSFDPHHSHSTLSEPEEGISSDPEYFDEDDMYYASYDDESVCSSPEPISESVQSSSESISESSSDIEEMVWLFPHFTCVDGLTSETGLYTHD